MTASWWLKLDRAEKHLKDLDGEISAYIDRHPHKGVRVPNCKDHGDCQLWVLRTVDPDPTLALIVGDAVHNMRSALDHLAVALTKRRYASFPIFVDDVEHPLTKTDREARARFDSAIQGMDPRAKAIIKSYQPYRATTAVDRHAHGLAVISSIDNADKHRALILLSSGLTHARTLFRLHDRVVYEVGNLPSEGLLENGAVIGHFQVLPPEDPDAEVEVETSGTPAITMDIGVEEGEAEVRHMPLALAFLREHVIPDLEPFVRAP